jgi:hypothetical protein
LLLLLLLPFLLSFRAQRGTCCGRSEARTRLCLA